jgi:hypothetical protein
MPLAENDILDWQVNKPGKLGIPTGLPGYCGEHKIVVSRVQ